MKDLVLNLPTFGFVVATRAMLGAGIGMLVSEKFSAERRRRTALALMTIGAITTIPAVMAIVRGRRDAQGDALVA